jgi:hypothetical protein
MGVGLEQCSTVMVALVVAELAAYLVEQMVTAVAAPAEEAEAVAEPVVVVVVEVAVVAVVVAVPETLVHLVQSMLRGISHKFLNNLLLFLDGFDQQTYNISIRN